MLTQEDLQQIREAVAEAVRAELTPLAFAVARSGDSAKALAEALERLGQPVAPERKGAA